MSSATGSPSSRRPRAALWTGLPPRPPQAMGSSREAITTMTTATTHRHEVLFDVFRRPDGQPFIALGLYRDGKLVPATEELFFLELAPGTTFDTARQLSDALRLAVTHLGVTITQQQPVDD